MRRSLTAALAALTLASAIATPASADRDRHGRHHHRHHSDGDAVAAAAVVGLVGLVIGAAIAGSKHEARYEPVRDDLVVPPPEAPQPDAQGWYGPYAEPSRDGCFMQRWVFDRELGRTVPERRPVDCLQAAR